MKTARVRFGKITLKSSGNELRLLTNQVTNSNVRKMLAGSLRSIDHGATSDGVQCQPLAGFYSIIWSNGAIDTCGVIEDGIEDATGVIYMNQLLQSQIMDNNSLLQYYTQSPLGAVIETET